jgi:trans-aconitate 2-methyltransferase
VFRFSLTVFPKDEAHPAKKYTMKNSNDWQPDKYLKYKRERTQPSIDLVSKINIDFTPERIIDFGCGPGNSSQVLVKRWPSASLTGVDTSETMIAKAKSDFPDQQWLIGDARTFASNQKFDIVFSNATLQWIPDHENLLKHFHELLTDRGVIAVQLPMFWDMPLGKLIQRVAAEERWRDVMKGVSDLFTIHNYSFYYDLLSPYCRSVDVWVTDYLHILESPASIYEMVQTTGLRPYLERIKSDDDKKAFEKEVFDETVKAYPVQKNGKVIFPFTRLFFVGYK